jgi:hypothetical protein
MITAILDPVLSGAILFVMSLGFQWMKRVDSRLARIERNIGVE